jgi:hypothetical protein
MTRMSFVNACGKRFFQACEAAGILYSGAGMRMVGLLLRLREGPLPRKIDSKGLTCATASGLGQAVKLGWVSYDRLTDSYLLTAAGRVRLDELRAANLIELAEQLTRKIDNYQP